MLMRHKIKPKFSQLSILQFQEIMNSRLLFKKKKETFTAEADLTSSFGLVLCLIESRLPSFHLGRGPWGPGDHTEQWECPKRLAQLTQGHVSSQSQEEQVRVWSESSLSFSRSLHCCLCITPVIWGCRDAV